MSNDQDSQYKQKYILNSPKHTVIEKVAAELAGTWYEIGRAQGLTSKWKTPQAYARANFEKFIPKAMEHLLTILGRADISTVMKDEIYNAIMERHNDKGLNDIMPNPLLPNIDITQLLPKVDTRVQNIITDACVAPFRRKKGF